MDFNNQGFYNQNGQNPMNMNYFNMQNELLKCVMEGMGEQPKNTYKENLEYIMNYVPFDYGNSSSVGTGNLITLSFRSDSLGETKIKIGEDTELKQVFQEYGRINNISNNINKYTFVCQAKPYNVNSTGTPKSNNFKENIPIVVLSLSNN